MSENSAEGPSNPERRNFLKIVGKAVLGAGALWATSQIPSVLKTPVGDADIAPAQEQKDKEKDPGFDKLNEILALPLSSKERLKKENEYVEWAQNLEQIDNGFMGVFDMNSRGKLLDKRFAIREKGSPYLRPLLDDERKWALDNGFHPECLAICIDSYNEALNILKSKFRALGGVEFYNLFRPDLVAFAKTEGSAFTKADLVDMQTRENSVEDMLMNPGGMLYLINKETGMNLPPSNLRYLFVHIGTRPAKDMLARKYPEGSNPEDPHQGTRLIEALKKICQKLTKKGPLNYDADNVPGSEVSGDVGSFQALPETFVNEYEFFEQKFNRTYNPFGLDAIVLANLFLAHGWAWTTVKGEQKQTGYLKDSIDGKNRAPFRMESLVKWNENSAEDTLKWAEKYYTEVIHPRYLPKKPIEI